MVVLFGDTAIDSTMPQVSPKTKPETSFDGMSKGQSRTLHPVRARSNSKMLTVSWDRRTCSQWSSNHPANLGIATDPCDPSTHRICYRVLWSWRTNRPHRHLHRVLVLCDRCAQIPTSSDLHWRYKFSLRIRRRFERDIFGCSIRRRRLYHPETTYSTELHDESSTRPKSGATFRFQSSTHRHCNPQSKKEYGCRWGPNLAQ